MRRVFLPASIRQGIYARRAGRGDSPPILFGSHIDSVPSGGNFDGAPGVLSAIEVVQALNAAKMVTDHPLEIVVWAHGEGATFPKWPQRESSVAGRLQNEELEHTWNGLTKRDGIRRIGAIPAASRRHPAGHFEVSPNAANVVPGEATLSIELRDLSEAKLAPR
jgi:hypothetical protein